MKHRQKFFILTLFLSLLPCVAQAGKTIFMVDISAGMANSCEDVGLSPLDIVRRDIENYTSRDGKTKPGTLLVYSDRVMGPESYSSTSRIEGIFPAPHQNVALGDIGLAITASKVELLRGGARKLVFYHGSKLADPIQVNTALSAILSRGIEVDLVLVGNTTRPSLMLGHDLFKIRNLSCGGSLILDERIRQLVAAESGAAPDSISLETDLQEDLNMDAMDASELVSMLAAEFGRDPPQREITRVGDLQKMLISKTKSLGDITPSSDIPTTHYVQRVFYATNRAPGSGRRANDYFGGERGHSAQLNYGVTEVSIPLARHKFGKAEKPLFNIRLFQDGRRHMIIRKLEELDKTSFLYQVQETASRSLTGEEWSRGAFVFIHGYNVRFPNAIRRTAQMAFDYDFTGAPILFSWPSDGHIRAYLSDREDVEWSIRHLELFLLDLSESLPEQPLHIVAHSMGNEGLVRALVRIALQRDAVLPPLFNNIILAAPDVDAQIFSEQLATSLVPLAQHWTLYESNKDKALNFSTKLRNSKRLGLPITVMQGVDTIDASGVEVTPWNAPQFHSYFATKQNVVTDLISVFKGIRPSARALLRKTHEQLPYWTLDLTRDENGG